MREERVSEGVEGVRECVCGVRKWVCMGHLPGTCNVKISRVLSSMLVLNQKKFYNRETIAALNYELQ